MGRWAIPPEVHGGGRFLLRRRDFTPAYLKTYEEGRLQEKVAQALAGAFNCGVNDLPLSLVLSWYEQKAVAVLLTLLFLGVRNMRIGPTLPAFLSPDVLALLHEKFNLMPIGTAEQDLAAMLN